MITQLKYPITLTDIYTNKTFTIQPNHLVVVVFDLVVKAEISMFNQHYVDLYHITSLEEVPTLKKVKIDEVRYECTFGKDPIDCSQIVI